MKLFLIVYFCIIIAAFLMAIKDFKSFACTPKEIYECNNCNMFACVILSIVWFAFNPLLFVVRFLYWIFHVGREDES